MDLPWIFSKVTLLDHNLIWSDRNKHIRGNWTQLFFEGRKLIFCRARKHTVAVRPRREKLGFLHQTSFQQVTEVSCAVTKEREGRGNFLHCSFEIKWQKKKSCSVKLLHNLPHCIRRRFPGIDDCPALLQKPSEWKINSARIRDAPIQQ